MTFSSVTSAEIYKYRDDNGRLVFVDDKDKIPVKYQEDSSALDTSESSLGSYTSPNSNQETEISAIEPEPEINPYIRKKQDDHETAVTIKGNRILVPVEVGLGNRTVDLTLLLDTGATRTVFHREALAELDLPKGKSYKARIAGGGTLKSKKIRFRHITVGPFRIEKAYAMVINLQGRTVPFDGMLGMDFLKNHPYQVDFENQLINWEELD